MPIRPLRRAVVTAASAAALLGGAAAPASAGVLVESAPDCSAQSSSQVFLPWADLAYYFRAPDGGFEGGASGWSLAGARVGDGNESYDVARDAGTRSLHLRSGDSATSPVVCVGLEHPTIRFFSRERSGYLLASLRVEVLVEDHLGVVTALPVGSVAPTSSWQPTLPLVVTASLLPLLPDNYTPVAFRFHAEGGDWQIDNLYVDPVGRW